MPRFDRDVEILRRKALFVAYRDVTSRPCPSQEIAYLRTVKHSAPRYYIGKKRASCVISKLAENDYSEIKTMGPLKRKMYLSLFEKVKEIAQQRRFLGKPLSYVVEFAILEPAPEFYITTSSFKKIFCLSKRYGIDYVLKDALALNRGRDRHEPYKGKLKPIFSFS